MALDALCSEVPPEMVPTITKQETAKEAWSAIATMQVGDDRVKKSTAQQLRRQFDNATFQEGETVEDYALRLNSMAAYLTALGEEIKESQIVDKILRSLPIRLKQIAIAIKAMLDVLTMTVAELTWRLKEAEDSNEEPPPTLQHEGKLYLTKEEWDARRKKCEATHGSGGSSGGCVMDRGGNSHGRGRGRGVRGPPAGGPANSPCKRPGDECRRCGKLGH